MITGTRLRGVALRAGGATAIFLVALIARTAVVLNSAGYGGGMSYDSAVYYTAADAFDFGRMPYRDFMLLHPPGIMLVLTPFAALGNVTSDQFGFAVANIAFTLLSAVNAVLVVVVARRMGLAHRAALVAGFCYALYLGAVVSEFSTRLEPLGNLLALLGLLAFYDRDRTRRRGPFLCGLAFGAAVSVKIWWAVPLLVLVIACARRPRRTAPLWALGGAAVSCTLIDGPFFLAAPHAMYQLVVEDQLGRPRVDTSLLVRLGRLSSFLHFGGRLPVTTGVVVAAALVLTVTLGAAALGWQVRAARPVVALMLVQVVVLCVTPSFYYFYCDYLTVPVVLSVAAALTHLVDLPVGDRMRRVLRTAAWLPALVLAASLAIAFDLGNVTGTRSYPERAQVAEAVAGERCVMSDTPMALIATDVLSRDLADGCPNWVDVTGRTYSRPDEPHRPWQTRRTDGPWQHALRRYLASGDSVIISRRRGTGLDHLTVHYLRSFGVVDKTRSMTVFDTQPLHAKF